jgi:PAS domain S-box-containing protein
MSAEWQFLIALSERLRSLTDPVSIIDAAARLLCQQLHANRVNFAHIDGDDLVIVRSHSDGVAPLAGRSPVAIFGAAIVAACRRGQTVVVNDVEADPRFTDAERAQLLARTAAFVGVPLIKDGGWVAMLGVHCVAPRTWTPDQITLVELTAERTWGAGERARADEALDRQAFLRRLNEITRPLADPARILAETCRLLGTYLHVNRVAYGEIEGNDCTIVGEYVDGLPRQSSRFCWRNLAGSRTEDILKGGTLSVNDTSSGPHTAEERTALQAAGIGAYLCPLLMKNGCLVAGFGIHSRGPRVWTPDEIALAQEVADRTWTTLEQRKAEAGLRANEERLAFLLRLNDALRPLSDAAAVQETAARLLGEHLSATRVGYAEVEGREYVIRYEYTRGVAPLTGPSGGITIGPELREALRRGETIVVQDVRTDPRLTDDDRARMQLRQIAALVGVALFKNGQMVAAFGANHNRPRVWTASEIELVRDVAERTWDAVERTRAQAALRDQGQRLRVALEASAGGSWTWVAATNQTDWDDRFRSLYGFTPDEPANPHAWLPRVHADDRARVLAVLEEMMTSTKESWENTFRIVRPDGTVAWIQSRGRAERDGDGRLTRLSGLDLDFNQHRRSEEALQARRDEERDRALRTLLETATQGIVSVDVDGAIVTANHAFEAMFGWPTGELIGQSIERLMPIAFRAAHARHRADYVAAPHPRLMGGGLHLVGQRKDGTTFPIEVSLNHVATAGGGRAFAFVTDITERQRAASALQARTAELEYRTMQLSRMASELTLAEQHAREQIARTLHDGLQQLLVIVALNLEQHLKHESESGIGPSELVSDAKHHLDEAIAAARSLNFELFPPVLQRSGLPAALKWLARWIHDKYKLAVQVSADARADSARKDVRTLLFESVRELLFNAVKHAAADRATLELTLDGDDQLCITVADQGIGFDPAKLDDRSKTGQTGWGLFSIRERLTLLGGRFEIDSAPGLGTRVRLRAPRGAAQHAAADADAKVLRLAPIAYPSAYDNLRAAPDALRILIVDDHATVRKMLREILHEQPQLSVVGDAANGFEAIAHAHALRPDVIVMDVAMPHMDGIEATARIRTELPDIEILGLSMHPRSEAVHAIEHAGAADFFVKGIDTLRLIDHLLAFHAARGAGERAGS